MNTALVAVPHPSLKDYSNNPVLKDIDSASKDNNLVYELDMRRIRLSDLLVKSPELGDDARNVIIRIEKQGISTIRVNLDHVKIYAVAQHK